MSVSTSEADKDPDAVEFFKGSVFVEAAVLACAVLYFLWHHAPHHAIAVGAALLIFPGYLWGAMRRETVYWMLLPRMAMWGCAVGWVSTFEFSDREWQVLSGVTGAAAILLNSCMARRNLRTEIQSIDYDAARQFLALVLLEAAALACGAGYVLWDKVPVVPYNAIALLTGAVLIVGYIWLSLTVEMIYWLLVPRMLMWGSFIGWAMAFVYKDLSLSPDLGWQVFGACIGATLILWNARVAKEHIAFLS